ncbi:hypothetical protein EON67_10845 [archaeon]|nr:MAG: hypothetical protein EON67_10845 [archaeon]
MCECAACRIPRRASHDHVALSRTPLARVNAQPLQLQSLSSRQPQQVVLLWRPSCGEGLNHPALFTVRSCAKHGCCRNVNTAARVCSDAHEQDAATRSGGFMLVLRQHMCASPTSAAPAPAPAAVFAAHHGRRGCNRSAQ